MELSMKCRKIIVVDKEIDAHLGALASAALKKLGMEILDDVNMLINSIREEEDGSEKLAFED